MKIVFQGDSITDAGRDKRNYHQLGAGYPKFAAEYISESFPDADIEIVEAHHNRKADAPSGTAKMLAETKGDPIALCRAVCSPGGSTIEGVKTLENGGVDSLFSGAVEASYKRNVELGK